MEGLELDGYCPEINIAFEFNGRQHVEYVEHFHISLEGFEQQKERDKRKQQICKDMVIFLCIISHTYTYREPEKMEKFIRDWLISPILDEKVGFSL